MQNLSLLRTVIEDSIKDIHGAIVDHPEPLPNDEGPTHVLVASLTDTLMSLERVEAQGDHGIVKDDIVESDGYRAAQALLGRIRELDFDHQADAEKHIRLVSRVVLVDLPIYEWEGFFTVLQPVLHDMNRSYYDQDDLSEVVADTTDEEVTVVAEMETVIT